MKFNRICKCGRKLRDKNPHEECYKCKEENTYKNKYERLKTEFEKHKELERLVHLDLWKRLKKYEPDLTWDEEPE